jgi:chemotaxis signal transduction protein
LRQTALPVFDLSSYLGFTWSGEHSEEERRIIVVKKDEKVVVLRVDRVLKLASHTREATLPPLSETLLRNKALFRSMLLSKDEVGGLKHVLRFDTSALIQKLTSPETWGVERV